MARLGRVLTAAALSGAMMTNAAAMGQVKPPPDAPKSWIPERKTIDDGRAAIVDPPLSEAEKRELAERERRQAAANQPTDDLVPPNLPTPETVEASILECMADASAATVMRGNAGANSDAGKKVSGQFAIPFTQARDLITERKFADALPFITEASNHTNGDPGLDLAVEQLRTAVFAGTNNPAALILSLERQLATGAVPLNQARAHCESIQGLKASQGLPPYDAGRADRHVAE